MDLDFCTLFTYLMIGSSCSALAVILFMQALSPRFVVNRGTMAVSKGWWWDRVWSLPAHMLNPFGRKLRLAWIALTWVFFIALGVVVVFC